MTIPNRFGPTRGYKGEQCCRHNKPLWQGCPWCTGLLRGWLEPGSLQTEEPTLVGTGEDPDPFEEAAQVAAEPAESDLPEGGGSSRG
jgi:hypothetical protein